MYNRHYRLTAKQVAHILGKSYKTARKIYRGYQDALNYSKYMQITISEMARIEDLPEITIIERLKN